MSCALCGTGIKNGGSIKMQRSLIHEDQGSKCGKVAMTGIKLYLHGSLVQEGRGFQCRLCGVEINKPANLIEHEGGWCRLINFKCDPCGTGDFKHVKMKSHRTAEHIKEVNEDSVEVDLFFVKPEKKVSKGVDLSLDSKCLHEGRTYKCCLCGKVSATGIVVKTPKICLHKGCSMSCGPCGIRLKNRGSMNIHKNQIHGRQRL